MAIISIARLKEWFSTGKRPTGEHFASLIDSFFHKGEKIGMANIDGLTVALNNKLTAETGAGQPYVVADLGVFASNAALTAVLDGLNLASTPGNRQIYSFGSPYGERARGYVVCGGDSYPWQLLVYTADVTAGGVLAESGNMSSDVMPMLYRHKVGNSWGKWQRVASMADIAKAKMRVTNSDKLNDVIKELYVDDCSSAHLNISRIWKDVQIDDRGGCASCVVVSLYEEPVARFYLKTQSAGEPLPSFICCKPLAGHQERVYMVIDWSKMPAGKYYEAEDETLGIIENHCTSFSRGLSLHPTIYAFMVSESEVVEEEYYPDSSDDFA